jgi:hypothetical protein
MPCDTWNWLNYVKVLKIKHSNTIYLTQLCKFVTKHIIKFKIILTMLVQTKDNFNYNYTDPK